MPTILIWLTKKFDELKAQNFEANSAEFWSGVAQIFSGLGVYFASGASKF